MKFGVLQFFSWPERRVPLEQVYARAIERVRIMDNGGYDAVWLAEHHFSTYSVCPSVHLMGMHLAGVTEQLRIGTGVSLAAFYHPLRLAEELALLDQLSGGRLNVGFGRGFDATEMQVFGVAPDESHARFREHVDIVLRAWGDGPLTFEGTYHQYDGIEVLPKPRQQPMPTWVASTSPDAVAWAATEGHAIMMDPHSTHAEISAKQAGYRQALATRGFPQPRDLPVARLLAIAETDARAEAVARRGAEWTVASYLGPKSGAKSAEFGPMAGLDAAERVERYVNDVIIHGSPARVAERLQELNETMPLDYLLASILSHETFVRLTDEVMPRIQ